MDQHLTVEIDIQLYWCHTIDCSEVRNTMISNFSFENYIEQRYRTWNVSHRFVSHDEIDLLELGNRRHLENSFYIFYAIYFQLEQSLFKVPIFWTEISVRRVVGE